MTNYSELSLVEQPAIEPFQSLEYTHQNCFHGAFGEQGTLGRAAFSEIGLIPKLEESLIKLNPSLPAEAIDQAIEEITRDRGCFRFNLYPASRNHVSCNLYKGSKNNSKENNMIKIRKTREADFEDIWNIFHWVVKTGDTFAFDPASNREDCCALWMSPNMRTYVATLQGKILGTYILKNNQSGLGAHVANAAYMVHPNTRGKSIGWAMGMHSVKQAKKLGFSAIQFNFVVSTNLVAVELWLKLGFRIVGIVPIIQHDKMQMT